MTARTHRRRKAAKVFAAVVAPLIILSWALLVLQGWCFSSSYIAQKEQYFRDVSVQAASHLDGKELPEDDLAAIMRHSEMAAGITLALFIPSGETGEAGETGETYGTIDFDVITCGGYLPTEMPSLVWDMAMSDDGISTAGPLPVNDQGDEYLIGTRPVAVNGRACVLGIVLSLQPVEEAADVLIGISWVIFAAMALFSIVIAFVVSLLVTCPPSGGGLEREKM